MTYFVLVLRCQTLHHINRFGIYEVRDREPAPVDYGVIFDMVESLASQDKDEIGH